MSQSPSAAPGDVENIVRDRPGLGRENCPFPGAPPGRTARTSGSGLRSHRLRPFVLFRAALLQSTALMVASDLADEILGKSPRRPCASTNRRTGFVCLCAGQPTLHAQDFKVLDRKVQVHGFASQGFIYTNDNNWLTMNTSQGSAAFTDFGLNVSTSLTDKLLVGAQVYDRNLGQLGQYHPSLDWAVVDYRFKRWFGVRGGKVKTTLGLYNDTQDLDFLRPFALLPQSVYPTDLRDATIAHLGGDIYGRLHSSTGSAIYPIPPMPGIAVTASIAASRTSPPRINLLLKLWGIAVWRRSPMEHSAEGSADRSIPNE